jgi:hypothetical protein
MSSHLYRDEQREASDWGRGPTLPSDKASMLEDI